MEESPAVFGTPLQNLPKSWIGGAGDSPAGAQAPEVLISPQEWDEYLGRLPDAGSAHHVSIQARALKTISQLSLANHKLLTSIDCERREHAKQLDALLQKLHSDSEWRIKIHTLETELAVANKEVVSLRETCLTTSQQWQHCAHEVERLKRDVAFHQELVEQKDEAHKEACEELEAQYKAVLQENQDIKAKLKEYEFGTLSLPKRVSNSRSDEAGGSEAPHLSPTLSHDWAHVADLTGGSASRKLSKEGPHSDNGTPSLSRSLFQHASHGNSGKLTQVQEEHDKKMTEKDTKLKIAEVRAQRLEGLVRELQDKLHHANTELDTYRNTQRPASGSGNSTTRRLSSSDGTGAGAGRGARGAADHAAKHPVASDRHVDGFGHLAVSDSDVAARQEQLQGLLSEIRKAEGQLAAVQSQLKADQAASAAQQAELQSVHRELTTARSTLRDLQRQIEGVQSSLSSTAVSLRREQDRLDAVKRQCSDEAVHWEQRLEQLRSEAAELQQQRQQAAQSGQSGQGAGGSNEVSRLRQEVERLQGDLDRERENQETMLHELNQAQQRGNDYKQRYETSQRETERLKATVKHLEEQAQSEQEYLQETHTEMERLGKEAAAAQDEVKRLSAALAQQSREMSELQTALAAAQARAKAAVPSTQPERTSPHTSDGGTAKQLAVSTTTAHQSDRAHEGDSEEVTSLRERLLVSEAQAEALQGEVAAVRERLATFVSAAREAATALQGSEGASPEVLAPFLCVLRDTEVLYTDQQAHQPSVAKIRLLQGQLESLLTGIVSGRGAPDALISAVRAAATSCDLPTQLPPTTALASVPALQEPAAAARIAAGAYEPQWQPAYDSGTASYEHLSGYPHTYDESSAQGMGMDWDGYGDSYGDAEGDRHSRQDMGWAPGGNAQGVSQGGAAGGWGAKSGLATTDLLGDLDTEWKLPEPLPPPPVFI